MQIINFLIFFTIFITKSSAEVAFCDFDFHQIENESIYSCSLTLDNPEENEVTKIEQGEHLEGFSDADVVGLVYHSGFLNFVPQILCSRFYNIQKIDLSYSNLRFVTHESFEFCKELKSLAINSNRLDFIYINAFVNNSKLEMLNIDNTSLPSFPENTFDYLVNLKILKMQNNPFMDLPNETFYYFENLEILYMFNLELTIANVNWFDKNEKLKELYIYRNHISNLSQPIFSNLNSLEILDFSEANLRNFNCNGLKSLKKLNLNSNRFRNVDGATFIGCSILENLEILDLSNNEISIVEDFAFSSLKNLQNLDLSNNQIHQLQTNAFGGLENLHILSLSHNQISEFSIGIFSSLKNLLILNLNNNQLRVIRKTIFDEDLSKIEKINLNDNSVIAIDPEIFEAAVNLNQLELNGNVCENETMENFIENRDYYLERLEDCFQNFKWTAETFTNGTSDYFFHKTKQPGIFIKVNSSVTINIALTPFNAPYLPMIEVQIGTNSNMRSVIRKNQVRNVADMSTPNILKFNDVNEFRIIWIDRVLMVFRGNESWPFMAYTREDLFDIRYFGLKVIGTAALWTIEPIWT